MAAYAQLRFASSSETDLYAAEVPHPRLHCDSTCHTVAIPKMGLHAARHTTRGTVDAGAHAQHMPAGCNAPRASHRASYQVPLDFLRASLTRLSAAQPGRLGPMVQVAMAKLTLTLTPTLTPTPTLTLTLTPALTPTPTLTLTLTLTLLTLTLTRRLWPSCLRRSSRGCRRSCRGCSSAERAAGAAGGAWCVHGEGRVVCARSTERGVCVVWSVLCAACCVLRAASRTQEAGRRGAHRGRARARKPRGCVAV